MKTVQKWLCKTPLNEVEGSKFEFQVRVEKKRENCAGAARSSWHRVSFLTQSATKHPVY